MTKRADGGYSGGPLPDGVKPPKRPAAWVPVKEAIVRKNPPRLLRSGLSGRVYVLLRYRREVRGDKEHFTAFEKWDVTEDFNRIRDDAGPSHSGEER